MIVKQRVVDHRIEKLLSVVYIDRRTTNLNRPAIIYINDQIVGQIRHFGTRRGKPCDEWEWHSSSFGGHGFVQTENLAVLSIMVRYLGYFDLITEALVKIKVIKPVVELPPAKVKRK